MTDDTKKLSDEALADLLRAVKQYQPPPGVGGHEWTARMAVRVVDLEALVREVQAGRRDVTVGASHRLAQPDALKVLSELVHQYVPAHSLERGRAALRDVLGLALPESTP